MSNATSGWQCKFTLIHDASRRAAMPAIRCPPCHEQSISPLESRIKEIILFLAPWLADDPRQRARRRGRGGGGEFKFDAKPQPMARFDFELRSIFRESCACRARAQRSSLRHHTNPRTAVGFHEVRAGPQVATPLTSPAMKPPHG